MQPQIGRRILLGAGLASLAAPALPQGGSLGGGFPQRPLRLIIGWPPGGGVDAFGRILAPALAEQLGQPVVIENIGGASGRIGSQAAARAAADGHTLLLVNDTYAATEAVPAPGAQPFGAALVPVAQGIAAPNALITHPRSGLGDIATFAAAARARPGALNIGIPGWGTSQHLSSELLLRAAGGLRAEHVSYRGGGPLLVDLLGGKLDAGVVTLAAAAEHLRDGRLAGLVVTTRTRNAAFPAVPAATEGLAPGFHLESWQGLFAPAGSPAAALLRVQEANVAALAGPAVQARLAALGFDVASSDAAGFGALVADTISRFARVAQDAGIRAEGV